MSTLKLILVSIINFIRRNPLFVAFLVIIAIGAPWLFGVFALILLVPMLLIAISLVPAIRSVRRAQRAAEEQHRRYGDATYASPNDGETDSRREGEVTVITTEPAQKKVSDDVGEYVDFKEVK